MHEQRQYMRYQPNISARYIYVRGMVALEEDTKVDDLSVTGMRLHISSVVRTGDVFLAEIPLPLLGTISAIAKVVWTEDKEAGVVFDWVSNAPRLERYIEELERKAA